MSVQRAIRRRRARKNGVKWPSRTMPFRDKRDGVPIKDGYDALRPTKSWLHVSTARLRAQFRLSELRAFIDRKMRRA